jgi:hypothetical protein
MKKLFVIFLIVMVVPQLVFAADGPARHSCKVCGMYIDQFHDTSCDLVRRDGVEFHTCGVACMLRLVTDEGGPDAFSSIMVHDWQSKEPTPAGDASYVIGSRKIPDMLPNLIAFRDEKDADSFASREGGEVLNFTQALLSISPMGMTMPTRLKTAVLPPRGALSVGVGYMYMTMDKVKLGTKSVDPDDFVRRPGQMMGPKKMESSGEMLMVNYAVTDDLSAGLGLSYLHKKMQMYKMGGKVTETAENDGIGDLSLNVRYGLWRDAVYSKFFSLLAETTLPTGDFDRKFIDSPGLQTGTGAVSVLGGLLFSHRYKDLWFHYLASYTANFENGDDYKFGNLARAAAAVHYTPNYDFMAGLEIDFNHTEKDEFGNAKVGNTGGDRSTLSAVADWKFLTALGGNFSIRVTGGLPIYEDLNHYSMGMMEKAKLGGGYFANVLLSFKRRYPVY